MDRDITDTDQDDDSILRGIVAACLCWSLALFFYIKKVLKRRRRRINQDQQQEPERQQLTGSNVEYGSSSSSSLQSTQSLPAKSSVTCSSISTVISLTTLGALDELSYFPALIVGNIFTPLEICPGTLLAALIILGVITTLFIEISAHGRHPGSHSYLCCHFNLCNGLDGWSSLRFIH